MKYQHKKIKGCFSSGSSGRNEAKYKGCSVVVGAIVAGLIAGAAVAQEPTPNTFVDVPVPQLTGWNEVNRLTVLPGIDGYTGASARTQIYTDQANKEAAELAFETDPGGESTNIEDLLWTNSPAAVYFELDDGSGRPPGIQVVTDDFDFPTNNCIMASGERESADFPGTIVPKLCSDPPSSSKRYFMEFRESDTPVDLVFDIGLKDIRYGGVKDPADDGGEALAAFREEYGIGRIYRVIQKVINNTDERWVGINVELGHGVGADFERFNFAEDGVAFELRNFVPREFFDGETGAPDIEVWDPERYSTFSPKLFDTGERERFEPGFFDDAAGGLFPPQDTSGDPEKSPFIFSGTTATSDGSVGAITTNHFSMVDAQAMGSTVTQGVFGYLLSDSLAPFVIARYDEGDPEGESDAVEAWWDGTAWRYGLAGDASGLNPFSVVPDSQLEQWAAKLLGIDPAQLDDAVRYDAILGDDFATQNMDVYIYISEGILNEEGAPKFDNITLRVTGVSTASAGLTTASLGNDIPAWIDVNGDNNAPTLASYAPATGVPVALNDLETMFENDPSSPFYEADAEILNIPVLANDLLDGGLLLDSGATITDVAISAQTNGTAVLQPDNTVNFTPDVGFTGLASFTYTVSIDDGAGGTEISNEATVGIRVNPYPDPEAPIAANDSAVTFKNTPVTIDVLANDTLPVGDASVAVLDAPLTGSASIVDGQVVYTPANNFVGLDRFTYIVIANGKVSNAALITVRVDEPPVVEPEEPAPSSGGGTLFGCSYNPGAPFDPTLPLLAMAAIAGLAYRKRRQA
ncbi:MAG: choice-of-anchor F family protein [Marinobacter adhaerens]|uniref:choice-of-anchor F family protein n=1 Tax=Marinobacter adhaerens TaxID=1033846 RepID=UPI003C3A9171